MASFTSVSLSERLVSVFGYLWFGAFVAAYLAAAVYFGGWWGLLALIFPVLVGLGALRYR